MHTSSKSGAIVFAAVSLVASAVTLARAQAPGSPQATQEARAQFAQGVEQFGRGDYAAALDAFKRAFKLRPHPAVRVNMANCYVRLDRPVEAIENFERYLTERAGQLSDDERSEVQRQIAATRQNVGELAIRLSPPGAMVRIDGGEPYLAPLSGPIRVRAGRHVLESHMSGHAPDRREVSVNGTMGIVVDIRLVPAAGTGPAPLFGPPPGPPPMATRPVGPPPRPAPTPPPVQATGGPPAFGPPPVAGAPGPASVPPPAVPPRSLAAAPAPAPFSATPAPPPASQPPARPAAPPPSAPATIAAVTPPVPAAGQPPAATTMPGAPPAGRSGRLRVEGPIGAQVSVDGDEVGTTPWEGTVRAGRRRLHVRDAAGATWQGRVRVANGASVTAAVELANTRGTAPSLFWTGVGVTAAGAVVWGVLGASALSAQAEFENIANTIAAGGYTDELRARGQDAANRASALALGADVSMIVTALAAAGTIVLYTQTRWQSTESRATISWLGAPTPGGAMVVAAGRF